MKHIFTFLTGLLAGLAATGLLFLLIAKPRGEPIVLSPAPTASPLKVHVSGAVVRPGVFTLMPDAIVYDAIHAAGGPLPTALIEAVNLAEGLTTGQQINVPFRPAEVDPSNPGTAVNQASSGLIDINTASAAELETLPGIGPSLAKSIVEYRENNGAFTTSDELLDVPGIGPAKLTQIKDLIVP